MFVNRELWAEIRRRVLIDEISKREACRRYEIHWSTLLLRRQQPPSMGYLPVEGFRDRLLVTDQGYEQVAPRSEDLSTLFG